MTGVAAPSVLDRILVHKRAEVAESMRRRSLPRVREAAVTRPPARDFLAALRTPPGSGRPRLIAEIKKSSPSRADLAPALDVRETARIYARAGASAVSVLTDSQFFGGSLEDLEAVRQEVDLPLLRKDFLVHPYQLFEARAAGADAALLIVAALASPLGSPEGLEAAVEPGEPDYGAARERLEALLEVARAAGVTCLVEVHDLPEMEVARAAGAGLIGINNRDLRTLETHLEVTERLAPAAPAGAVLVSESGVETGADVRRLRRAGASAILVGSAIVSAPDPAARIRELLQ